MTRTTRTRCSARLYNCREPEPPPCTGAAHTTIDGHPLCWVHAVTVGRPGASLAHVLAGTRENPYSYSARYAQEEKQCSTKQK